MVYLAVMTSMNVAEICGLRWKRINLNAESVIMDDELLRPSTVAVREQWYKGEWGSVKAKARRRYVPIPQFAVDELRELRQRENWLGPEDPVFVGVAGQPICENAIVQRYLKPAGKKLGMPWLSWHALRRTFATLADQEGMSIGERKTLMGHARAEMTLHYTQVPDGPAIEVLQRMSDKIVNGAKLTQPKGKLMMMKLGGK
jgi:integrase